MKLILKDETHHFINEYPDKDDLDMRKQSTNFADIPILADEIRNILDECEIDDGDIDAFVLTPLNSNDLPIETLEFLKTFDVPIFISLQGFLRFKDENNSMVLKLSDELKYVFDISDTIFMDEGEFDIIRGVSGFGNVKGKPYKIGRACRTDHRF